MPARRNDPPWLKAAYDDLDIREIPGAQDNPRIVQMFHDCGHTQINDDETAWCAAAIGSWLKRSGIEGTGKLNARSYENFGRALDKSKKLPRGAILVFPRGNSSWMGHVCQLVEDQGNILVVIGGNQKNSVCFAQYRRDRLVEARWPDVEPLSPDPKPPVAQPVIVTGPTEAKLGHTGIEVEVLQRRLKELGYPLKVDGIFGHRTESMLMEFQSVEGIDKTGILDDRTKARLDIALPRPVSEERATVTKKDVESRTVKEAEKVGLWGRVKLILATALGGGTLTSSNLLETAEDLADKGERVKGVWNSVSGFFEPLASPAGVVVLGLLIGVGVLMIYREQRVTKLRIEDQRTGAHI